MGRSERSDLLLPAFTILRGLVDYFKSTWILLGLGGCNLQGQGSLVILAFTAESWVD